MADFANTIPRDWFYNTHHRYHPVGPIPMTSSKMKYLLKTPKTGMWWHPGELILEEPGLEL
jgi:hypothetical protein